MDAKIMIVFILFSCSFVNAKELFVSTTGSDSVSYANNDINNPWATPRKAWTEARAGDTVFFREGTYTIANTIDTEGAGYDGNEANPITFSNYQNEYVLFECGSLWPCFNIERSWNVVDGINFNGGRTVFRLGYNSLADHFTVQNCEAHTTLDAIQGENFGFVHINHYNAGNKADYTTIQNCIIEGPGIGASDNVASVVVFEAIGTKILNNEIYNYPRGIYYKHANSGTNPGIEIAYNHIHHTGYYSIFSNSNYASIHNNIIGEHENIPDIGEFKFNSDNGGPGGDHNLVIHNTIYSVNLLLGSDAGGADYNTFKDNIIYSTTIESNCDGNEWDYNLHVTDSAIGSNDIFGSPDFIGGSSPSTIADFALVAGSPGKSAASDGKDMGADVSLVGPNVGSDCGNGNCNSGECDSCPVDCLFVDCCPDGNCNNDETCETCEADCGACSIDCVHATDQPPCDGCVDTIELSDYIDLWKSGTVDMADLMVVIGLWKNEC